MNPKEIPLSFNKADFEEIYFKDRSNKVLLSKNVKPYFILSIVAVCLLAASLIYSFVHHSGWGVVTVIAVIFVLAIYELSKKNSLAAKWKNSIRDHLDEQSKFISQKITLSEDTLTFKQDTKITIVRWAEFNRVVIDDKSITLYGNEDLLLPKKSFSYQDFDFLKEHVLLHMKG